MSVILSHALKQGIRRGDQKKKKKKTRWRETAKGADSRQLSSGKLKDWSVEKVTGARQRQRDEEAERERSEGRADSIRDSGTI